MVEYECDVKRLKDGFERNEKMGRGMKEMMDDARVMQFNFAIVEFGLID